METGYTHLALLVERTTAMETVEADLQAALDDMIREHRTAPGRTTVELYLYSESLAHVISPTRAEQVGVVKLEPRDEDSFLYDGLGQAITQTRDWVRGLAEGSRPERIAFTTVSFSPDAGSPSWTPQRVAALIQPLQQSTDSSWYFQLLAMDRDARGQARVFGIPESAATRFSRHTVRPAITAASAAIFTGRGSGRFPDLPEAAG
jgi:hypothetical protein